MKRYAQERHIVRRRWKFWDRLMRGQLWQDNEDGRNESRFKPGHFRKRKPLDCGRPRCGVCHADKKFGRELTQQELKADSPEL